MKNLFNSSKYIILTSIILIFALQSCVTTSKYEDMVYKRDSIENKFNNLSKELDFMLLNKNKTIQDNENQISELNKILKKVNVDLEVYKNKYRDLTEVSSKDNMLKLNEIENLRKEANSKGEKYNELLMKLRERDNKIESIQKKLKEALLSFRDLGLDVNIKDGKVYVSLSNQLLFSSGSINIDKKGLEALKFLSEVINNTSDITILVEGHTDNQRVGNGSRFNDNWELSVLRATEVVKYLQLEGKVDPTRLVASGKGEYSPLEVGDSAENRSKNRRTEVIIIPKLDVLYNILD